ncbi:TRAP transporter large permease [Suttonella sp. R2A3]|uniref:TRAP transporter large permease n=1 Tax=Suttonella sp. R2A3 TaxID=2908648 RepID=UPI001F371FF5|nr:TRAP transporter large permease [Suttonella sp. R2A3]UJF24217.1 TRAP transporter large permease [Suttonella sp. R2A3]
MTESLFGIGALMVLLFARVPLAFAMAFIGFAGYYFLLGGNYNAAMAMTTRRIVDTAMEYNLSIVPLFILMGNFVNKAGLSDAIYRASNAFIGHFRGGQAMATILACGGFSAISGSSLATAATMAKVAMPQMRQYGYDDSLASASIAAGGTLGILIPPSIILVIYGIITEQNIIDLFAAGLIPGILGVILYLLAVVYSVRRREGCTRSDKSSWYERWQSLLGVSHTMLLFFLVIGGIYAGWFTPTQAAAIGAFGAMILALANRKLSWGDLREVLIDSARTSCMLFSIIIAALIFSNFVNRAGLPNALLGMISAAELSPIMVIMLIIVIYFVLGCMLESMSMLLLTVPLFFPIVAGLGFDLVWFGVLVVVAIEISLITPPVGMNVFVLQGVLPDVTAGTIFRGIMPFLVADIIRILLIALIPGLSLWLPTLINQWTGG